MFRRPHFNTTPLVRKMSATDNPLIVDVFYGQHQTTAILFVILELSMQVA